MQIRCHIQLGGQSKKLVLVSQENETPQHLALKLAAFVLFFDWNPMAEVSAKHPAVAGQEFKPDLIALNVAGEIRLWLECGNVTTNKLDKISRRYREARLVVLKENEREARNLRKWLDKDDVHRQERIEIWAFPEKQFDAWMEAMDDNVEIFGEKAERSLNLVANGRPFCFDFLTA